ncbi:YiiX/YebB-like N1pC/P60 family cysteine hydrolase [Paenibacillus cisolokensis]|uniref:YiiX/YebB-like N1pC/P60 family cysteine hydrolase n=1 Tax=Paenibacillus cisolokensis TaxID=1658519 RepID=UPI003D2AFC52
MFRNYDEAVGLWVPDASSDQRYDTKVYAFQQRGEPYNANATLITEDDWYCSKLIWAAFYRKVDIDLGTSGYPYPVSLPDDLYDSSYTKVYLLFLYSFCY